MPGKNILKLYIEGGFYHLYNRGVERKNIFNDPQDYSVFLRFIKEYLLPLNHKDLQVLANLNKRRHPINCSKEVDLLAFCLMPNHFHLLVKQKSKQGIKIFMHALLTNYVMYFNHKYDRIGPLFQARYKAVLIEGESQFLQLSRYIHLNPKEIIIKDQPLKEYLYSSYSYYLKERKADWLKPEEVLEMFRSPKNLLPKDLLSYQSFVEGYITDQEPLNELTLE